MFFNILATFAEFEAGLLRMRTREGMAVARAKGKLRCPPGSSASWRRWPPLATTRLPTSPSCSPSPARPCTGPSSEPRLQTRPNNQPEPLPCTPGTPHRTADRPLADHRYLAVILNVVFTLDRAVSPLGAHVGRALDRRPSRNAANKT